MQTVFVKWGDIGQDPVDLTVLPCSGRMKELEVKRTQEKIEAIGLPSPEEMQSKNFSKGKIGEVSDLMQPNNPEALTKFAVYASTSFGGGSVEAMVKIGRKLGEISQSNPSVREIEAPFLGCGKSGFTPDIALPALAGGFLETRHPDAVLVLRNDDTLAEKVAREALKGLFAPHIVLLVHGIRTHANWQEPIKDTLSEAELIAQPIKYGFFNTVMTILPGPQRMIPVARIVREYRDVRQKFPDAKISAIGHSFGTYALVKAIQANSDISIHRLILCGSVVSESFRVADMQGRLNAPPILNECGWKDLVPVIARGAGTGLGAPGRFGFGTTNIEDRFHDYGHSEFLTPEFAKMYWLPFLKYGSIEKEGTLSDRPNTNWFVSVLSVKGMTTLLFIGLLLSLYFAGRSLLSLFV